MKTQDAHESVCMFVKSLGDPLKVGQLLFAAELHVCLLTEQQQGVHLRKHSTSNHNLCSCPVALCARVPVRFCSVPTVALKAAMIDFFFLFYAELGSVIRAPFLTDRSILITKSSACSKGSALWQLAQPGPRRERHLPTETAQSTRSMRWQRGGERSWD